MRIRKDNDEHEKDVLFLAKVSDALSHPARVAILKFVLNKSGIRHDICNGDLVNHFPYSQATISQHVKKMVDADLFIVKKKDKFSFYSVNQKTLSHYTALLRMR